MLHIMSSMHLIAWQARGTLPAVDVDAFVRGGVLRLRELEAVSVALLHSQAIAHNSDWGSAELLAIPTLSSAGTGLEEGRA